MYIKTPDEAQPGSLPGAGSAVSNQPVSHIMGPTGGQLTHQTEAASVRPSVRSQGGSGFDYNSQIKNGVSMEPHTVYYSKPPSSDPKSPNEIPMGNIPEDPFGAVPLNKAMKRSAKKMNVKPQVSASIPPSSAFTANSFPQTNVSSQDVDSDVRHAQHQSVINTAQRQGQYYAVNSPLDIQPPPDYSQHSMQAITQPHYQTSAYMLGQQQSQVMGAPTNLPFAQYYSNQQQLGNFQQLSPEALLHSQQVLSMQSLQGMINRTGAAHSQQIPVQQTFHQQNQQYSLNQTGQQGPQKSMYTSAAKQLSVSAQAKSFAQRPGDLPMTSATALPQSQQHSQQMTWDSAAQDDADWDTIGNYDDESKYQRLKARTVNKRVSRDVSISAFANMSFNDEDEFSLGSPSCDSPSGAQEMAVSSQNVYMSSYPHGEALPMNSEVGKAVVATAPTGYDSGTWPRKHRRHQAKAEPFSVSKK